MSVIAKKKPSFSKGAKRTSVSKASAKEVVESSARETNFRLGRGTSRCSNETEEGSLASSFFF